MKIWFDGPEKPLLIGQAPSRDTDGMPPFSGRSGKRIAMLMGISHDELRVRFALANILDSWPGKQGNGDAFPLELARKRGWQARTALKQRRVVAFGASVIKVLGYEPDDLMLLRFAYREAGNGKTAIAYVPHPSGVNRWWNDPDNAKRAQQFLYKLARW